MNSSRRDARQVPAPPQSRGGLPYTRFIPREELQGFAAWRPDAFNQPGDPAVAFAQPAAPGSAGASVRAAAVGERPASGPPAAWPAANDFSGGTAAMAGPGAGAATAASAARRMAEAAEPELVLDIGPSVESVRADMQADMHRQVTAARQQGYQDGYRDGLVALESFKESFASQVSGQMALVLQTLDRELGQLEQQLAARVARVATELARQVVRSELAVRPALVAQVAQEAVNAVLMSARHITVHVHTDDHALVAQGCAEALAARGARLLGGSTVPRGGCRVESDAGVIDARVATRWAQATQALGTGVAWDDGEADIVAGGSAGGAAGGANGAAAGGADA